MTIIIYWARFTDIIYRYISAVFKWFVRKRDIQSLESPQLSIRLRKLSFEQILHSNVYIQYAAHSSRVLHSSILALYYFNQSPKKIFS